MPKTYNDIYCEDIKLNDGMFEVALVPLKNKKDMLKAFFELSRYGLKNISNVTYYQTDNFELEFLDPPKVSWCIDGEEYKTSKHVLNFNVTGKMEMLLPKENINRLFKEE